MFTAIELRPVIILAIGMVALVAPIPWYGKPGFRHLGIIALIIGMLEIFLGLLELTLIVEHPGTDWIAYNTWGLTPLNASVILVVIGGAMLVVAVIDLFTNKWRELGNSFGVDDD